MFKTKRNKTDADGWTSVGTFEHAVLTCYTLLSPSITSSLFHSQLRTYLFSFYL